MRFLYSTDLHGDIDKYETILKYALDNKIRLIHLGADILPKGEGILKKQKKFLKGYLKNFYAECKRNRIKVLGYFGNDDCYSRKKYFTYGNPIDSKSYRRSGYIFKAYNCVPDHPFGLKNGTKLDFYDMEPCKLPVRLIPFGDGYLSVPAKAVDCCDDGDGFYVIEDLKEYFSCQGSIEDELYPIQGGPKTIISIHSPPAGLNLDVCGKFFKTVKPKPRERVGSKAVLKWIKEKQPLLVLSGHIHENYLVTGSWRASVGRTTVIQPGQHIVWKKGQKKKTTFVVIEVNGTKVEAERFEE